MTDRRKYNRLQLTLPLEIKESGKPKNLLKGKLLDISKGGAKFYFNEDVSIGTKMEITIDDYDDILAGKLGIEKKDGEPLGFTINAEVLRAEVQGPDKASQKVAVKFSQLLEFIPGDIYLN